MWSDQWANGALNATSFGPPCPQNHEPSPIDEEISGQSNEDCLVLNVYTPKANTGSPLPVVVWVHGGGFRVGTGNLYNGTRWLEHSPNVIVVTVNYRLGALGFLAVPDALGTTGNFGLLDQRLAVDWARVHIASFGGDPSRITIGGESAGAISAAFQLASPFAFPGSSPARFAGAILESGVYGAFLSTQTPSNATSGKVMALMLNLTNCSTLECLRGRNVSTLLNAQSKAIRLTNPPWGSLFGPLADDVFIYSPTKAKVLAKPPAVPIILGSNYLCYSFLANPSLDGPRGPFDGVPSLPSATSFLSFVRNETNAARYAIGVSPNVSNASILAHYPPDASGDFRSAVILMSGDSFFTCSTLAFARWLAGGVATGSKAFLYLYNVTRSCRLPASKAFLGQAVHTAELSFAWDSEVLFWSENTYCPFDEAERALVSQMITSWVHLATKGEPTQPTGSPVWPHVENASSPIYRLWGGHASTAVTAVPVVQGRCDAVFPAVWNVDDHFE